MAARFYLYVGDYSEARRIARKVSDGNKMSNASSVYDVEAFLVEQWCNLEEISMDWNNSSEQKRVLSSIDNIFRSNKTPEYQDPDALLLWAKSKFIAENYNEMFNILNQVKYF